MPPAAAHNLFAATGAHQIFLYGSRARGDAAKDSDLRLAVIIPDGIEPGQLTPSTLQPLVTSLGESYQVVAMRKSVYDEARLSAGMVSFDVWTEGVVIAGSPVK